MIDQNRQTKHQDNDNDKSILLTDNGNDDNDDTDVRGITDFRDIKLSLAHEYTFST